MCLSEGVRVVCGTLMVYEHHFGTGGSRHSGCNRKDDRQAGSGTDNGKIVLWK